MPLLAKWRNGVLFPETIILNLFELIEFKISSLIFDINPAHSLLRDIPKFFENLTGNVSVGHDVIIITFVFNFRTEFIQLCWGKIIMIFIAIVVLILLSLYSIFLN